MEEIRMRPNIKELDDCKQWVLERYVDGNWVTVKVGEYIEVLDEYLKKKHEE